MFICFLTTGYATLRVCRPGGQRMARDIVIIIWSVGLLAWPHLGLGQGTIYTWVDGKGERPLFRHTNRRSPLNRRRASTGVELWDAPGFRVASGNTAPRPLPAQGVTADAAADATEREAILNQGEGAAEGSQVRARRRFRARARRAVRPRHQQCV